ncbi:putative structural protein [Escherichia phage jat]|uniref:Putative structural protein n=1 Tax=Escherichia phage jat TaxID=2696411 RepID=A0A6B9XI38_9CAUD|nr:putative structural protein [Escherichia phage jat]QHR76434.1 putative structural protein [Escherichia phage jat]
MAGFNYAGLKRKVNPLIKKFGMMATVTRPGSVDRVDGDEVIIPPTSFDVIGLREEYKPSEIDGTRIVAGDVKFLCQAVKQVKVGDLVSLNNTDYRVINPNPLQPAGQTMLFQLQLRG